MLKNYDTSYSKTINQILVVNQQGEVIDSDSSLFKNIKGKNIISLHPFFETIVPLLNNPKQEYLFRCVNLDIENKEYTINLSINTEGKGENCVILIDDLTAHFNNYQKVAQVRNESKIKAQLLAYKNDLLVQQEAFKNNFIANFSHEIKMPLNTISGFSSILETTNLDQSQRYNLHVIKSTNDRLKKMIDDILDISKIETGYFKAHNIRFNIYDTLEVLKSIYIQKCKEKRLQFNFEIDDNCPIFLIGDPFRLSQIISNLLENAFKFTNKGSITLKLASKTTENDKLDLEFTITDTGIGIEKSKLKNIYNSFYQISNTQINQGTGLGLAIIKQLIAVQNGTITLASETDKGSTFKVNLNYGVSDDQELGKTVLKSSQETKHFDYKILVAETLKKDQVIILDILNSTEKYDVIFAKSGDEVIEELFNDTFDAVILNLKLPTMDGIDTARYIRLSEFPDFSEIPIIAISEKPSKKEEEKCLAQRINDYTSKPYQKNTLLEKLEKLIQKKRAQ